MFLGSLTLFNGEDVLLGTTVGGEQDPGESDSVIEIILGIIGAICMMVGTTSASCLARPSNESLALCNSLACFSIASARGRRGCTVDKNSSSCFCRDRIWDCIVVRVL